ncbi:MAG TPA: hypothetical protein VGR03_10315 [Candidatus Acidoferrum sp.]|nr:hypothetical protein [Candidatus Acidoferrum sp.]
MIRLRVDCLTVTSSKDRLAVTSSMNLFAVTSRNDCISITKSILALFVSFSLLTTPVWAAPSSSLGIVVYADRAHVGAAQASVGATVFSGDRISTDQSGSVQVRAGAARLLLSSASSATFSQDDASPTATLTFGSATFSTASSNAFALHVASAVIRPNSNQPTIGQVTVLNPKELIVKSTRGSLSIAVEDDVREIPEGAAYRIVLDPNAADPQGPRGAGTKGHGGPPIKAAKSRFIWYAIAVTAVITYFALDEVFESPDRP